MVCMCLTLVSQVCEWNELRLLVTWKRKLREVNRVDFFFFLNKKFKNVKDTVAVAKTSDS